MVLVQTKSTTTQSKRAALAAAGLVPMPSHPILAARAAKAAAK